ncbi:MAG TPA: glycosyltransferase family 1 protein [Sulfuriferula sp.]|nr:glycosyltransferase family 1 protein [Sulfuriferula sp.]
MHIADVTMFYTPVSGGVRTYLDAKRRWLNGHAQHSLIIPDSRRFDQGVIHGVPALPIPFGHGYRFPLRKRGWVDTLLQLRPDLIEAGDPYLTAWACVEAGQHLGVPVVGFYHSDLPRLVNSRLGHWTDPILDSYIRRLYRHFDRILAPSQVIANKLAHLGVENVRLQPLGVDTSQFHPRYRDVALKAELGIAKEIPLLIFAGRAAREKKIPLLLKAMELLGKNYHLLLVGPGMPRGVPDNVSVIHEYVAADRIARYLASSDALIHAGDSETFGLVVLEAMASGIPVIGTRKGAVAELVVPGCGLLAETVSAPALADAARNLFADGHLGMGRLARKRVEECYAWDRVLAQLLAQYQELTGYTGQKAEESRRA